MSPANLKFLTVLEQVIGDRLKNGSEKSYTASLAAQGPTRVAQKIGEEGVELALAAVAGSREDVIEESADLLYHVLIMLGSQGIALSEVVDTLEARHSD
jgi:phosphoribosyl-ATP pyrophosphohydrolase/phosphoribosyl-AMP cyclohydrolase